MCHMPVLVVAKLLCGQGEGDGQVAAGRRVPDRHGGYFLLAHHAALAAHHDDEVVVVVLAVDGLEQSLLLLQGHVVEAGDQAQGQLGVGLVGGGLAVQGSLHSTLGCLLGHFTELCGFESVGLLRRYLG